MPFFSQDFVNLFKAFSKGSFGFTTTPITDILYSKFPVNIEKFYYFVKDLTIFCQLSVFFN